MRFTRVRAVRLAVAMVTTALAVGLVSAAPAQAARTPLVLTAPKEAPAFSEFPFSVTVPAATSSTRRTGTLTASRDGKTFTRLSTWRIPKAGSTKSFTVQTGEEVGRIWLRAEVREGKKVVQARQTSVRITNPYRPTEPDNAQIPEEGVPVSGTLFGNHPIVGTPEFAGTVRLWDVSTSWNQIERRRGVYTWEALDREVAKAEAAGQQVLLVLGGTPEWAAVGPAPGAEFAGPGSSMPMTDPALFENYVRAVVGRYGGRIAAYQIWNEANISQFWRGTPELMADLTARANAIIKAAVPGATVVAASTGSRWVKGFTEFYPDYLAALREFNWPIDVFAVHLYPLPSGTPRDRVFLLGMMKTALTIAKAPALPIWETEINYGITNPGSGDAARPIPDADIPAYVARTYVDSLRFGVARSYWYAWTPEYRLLGIQMWNGYLATRAYAQVREWVIDSTFSGCSTTGAVVTCNFDRANVPFYIAYTDDESLASIPTPAGMTVYQTMDGVTVAAGSTVAVSGTPVLIAGPTG
ncbi:MAG: hypothetical protein WAO50_05950 [Candidatus Nanopelagicales bacterium]